jgi:hypothetical protein
MRKTKRAAHQFWESRSNPSRVVISSVPCLATILITLLLAVPAMSVELFVIEARPRTAARWNTSLRLVNRILPTP